MNNQFNFEAEQFEYATPGEALETMYPEQEAWEIGAPDAYEYESGGTAPPAPPPPLSGAALARALTANRTLARQIGWGCLQGGQAQPIPELLAFLGLPATATEEDVARAVAQWQETQMRRRGDGQLGSATWDRMLRATPPVIPAVRFKRLTQYVNFGGRRLGILEKIAPYQSFTNAGTGGAFLQLGFRVTDADTLRRSGFDHFNWIQRITTNRQLTGTSIIRKYGRYIDPQSPSIRDNHPYYWNVPTEGAAQFRVNCFTNRQPTRAPAPPCNPASARADAIPLCYDLIFQDYPRRSLHDADSLVADPGHRVYWNAEVALVGVLPPKSGVTRNVILNTAFWGFDLVMERGVRGVHLNALQPGPVGGSSEMRKALSYAIKGGLFPKHCFVGGGFSRAATCT